MKLISLNCNHCGAPIQVPDDARYATCRFCESQLAVERLDGAWTTRVLLQIQEQTEVLSTDVQELKQSLAVEQLDRQWDLERRRYLDKSGAPPNPWFFVKLGLVFPLVTTLAWNVAGLKSARLWPIVMQLILMFYGMAIFQHRLEARYLEAKGNYENKRAALLRGESESSGPQSDSSTS